MSSSELLRISTIFFIAIVCTCLVEGVPLFSLDDVSEPGASVEFVDFKFSPYGSKKLTKTAKPVTMPFGLPSFHGMLSKPVDSKPVIFEDDILYRTDKVKNTTINRKKISDGIGIVYGERFLAKSVITHNNCPENHAYSKTIKRCVRRYLLQESSAIG